MIVLDLSILNQKGTPMFNSDIFANRPTFGIVGRIFISTDTAAIYRDTGTAWDLIADGSSSSTNIYNSNGTLSANRVVSDGGFGLSFTSTTHIGTAAIGGGGNGKLIVGSSIADNGIQVFGANSPSIRIDNAQSGGSQRFVFGLATATNNFIQGATAGEFCISTQSAGNMLFGMWQTTNASEVMRITTANNLLVGLTVDAGQKMQVEGSVRIASSYSASGTVAIETWQRIGGSVSANITYDDANTSMNFGTSTSHLLNIKTNNTTALSIASNGAATFLNDLSVTGVFRETVTTNTQTTSSYSIVLTDNGKLILMNVAISNNLTIPLNSSINFPVGTKIDVSSIGAGQTTIVATSGVTINSAGGALKLRLQYSGATLVQTATNVWSLFGDITT